MSIWNHLKRMGAFLFTLRKNTLYSFVLCCLGTGAAMGEVVLDGSFGPNGPVSSIKDQGFLWYDISPEMGRQVNANLFHSFRLFNLKSTEAAYFYGPGEVENIITRVTGGQASSLNGGIFTDIPGADFYFINPAGILFGPDAWLEVDGSFHAGAADYLRLGEEGRFDAREPGNSRLSIQPPSAFGFVNPEPAVLSVVGNSNGGLDSLAKGDISLIGGDVRFDSSSVYTHTGSLTLAGKRVEVQDSTMRAEQGRINIAAPDIRIHNSLLAADDGQINVTGAELGNEIPLDAPADASLMEYGNIKISDSTQKANNLKRKFGNLDVSGEKGGRIYIRSGRFEMDNGYVFADTSGDRDGQGIEVKIEDEILFDNGSRLTAEAVDFGVKGAEATGNAGNINVSANQITLLGGSQFSSRTRTQGDAGEVKINAGESIYISGNAFFSEEVINSSGIASDTAAAGNAGRIEITSPVLTLAQSGTISNKTLAAGDAGTIKIDTGRLVLESGGGIQLDAGNVGVDKNIAGGDAGSLTINASEAVEISGDFQSVFSSGLTSNTWTNGKGGSIRLKTPSLSLKESGIIQTSTVHGADAGNISVEATRLKLSGKGGIHANTIGAGRGGRIHIVATKSIRIERVQELKFGNISTNTSGTGDGGEIILQTPQLEISQAGRIESGSEAEGSGGNIAIEAVSLNLDSRGQISSATEAEGKGGNITLKSGHARLGGESKISAQSSGSGNAGDIDMLAASLVIEEGAALTAQADFARGGNIELNSIGRIHLKDGEITARAQGEKEIDRGGNVTINNQDFLILDESRIIAAAKGGDGGNITIAADVFVASGNSVLDASSEQRVDGIVQISAPDKNVAAGLLIPVEKLLDKTASLHPCRASAKSSRLLSHAWEREAIPNSADDWLPGKRLPDFTSADVNNAVALLQGVEFFSQGRFERAVMLWEEVRKKPGLPTPLRLDVMTALADAYQNLGMYYKVLENLDAILPALEEHQDIERESRVLARFSDVWLAVGRPADALKPARKSAELAARADSPIAMVEALNNLANVLIVQAHQQEDYDAVFAHYAKALKQAELIGDKLLAAKIELNRLNALQVSGTIENASLLVQWEVFNALPPGYGKNFILIAAGILAESLNAENAAPDLRTFAAKAYAAALDTRHSGNNRLLSTAYGRLGAIYRAAGRYPEAHQATDSALFHAAAGKLPDEREALQNPAFELLYRWLWQKAAIYRDVNQADKAIDFYKKALKALAPVQLILGVGYRNPVRVFDEQIRPLYYELAEVLLKQAAASDAKKQRLLAETKNYIEQLRLAEMRNYFRDACILKNAEEEQARPMPLHNAALYPLPLSDRLELLLSLPDGIHRISVDVSRQALKAQADKLRRDIQTRTHWRFIKPAEKLYDWLIKPLQGLLSKQKIRTLAIVPDAFLRSIPFAPLINKNTGKYLVEEDYAVVVTPKFRTKPAEPQPAEFQMLLAGTSHVEGYSPLPSVPKELAGIKKLADDNGKIQTHILLDQAFSLSQFKRLLEENAYAIIHLATHGEFSTDPDYTYILARDGRIHMDQLKDLIGASRFREQELELLTLSACKTAAGDDRAALGLAGTAFKAGARSALAGLWHVDDEAAALLMQNFYAELIGSAGKQKGAKAEALQQAQRRLLKHPRFQHPVYWGPFLLVGDGT
ncbi:MAG: CHAT domain-containing protein [Gammaproteobacteria bacterium]|nr:CHAT domain-containing protein [Gammaproteobacteria bacterium]